MPARCAPVKAGAGTALLVIAPSNAGVAAPLGASAAGDDEMSIPAMRQTSKLLFMPLNYQRPGAAATKKNRQVGRGVGQNFAEAVKWYRKSAEQGNASGQWLLGMCYYYGRGVGQNYAEAVKWYRKAAEQGNANAQKNLGVCYEKGLGVSKDQAEADKWFHKAAEQKTQ